MKKLAVFAMAAIMAMSLCACSSGGTDASSSASGTSTSEVSNNSSSAASSTDKVYNVGLSMNSFDSFQTQWYESYVERANELGMNVTVTNSENDVNKQISDVEGFVSKGMDLLAVLCVDGDALASTIDEATEAGIPVYCPQFESSSENMICCPGLGLDQKQNGVLQCEALQQWLDDHPGETLKVGYLQGEMTIWSAQDRYNGFAESLPEGVELVVADNAHWSADDAMALVEDWLVTYSDLNCIAAANDEMAIAAVNVLKTNGITDFDEFPILGVDCGEEGAKMIANGELYASVFRNFIAEARMCADVGYAILQGQTFEGEKYVPSYTPDGTFVLVTKDNADTYMDEANADTPSVEDWISGNY